MKAVRRQDLTDEQWQSALVNIGDMQYPVVVDENGKVVVVVLTFGDPGLEIADMISQLGDALKA